LNAFVQKSKDIKQETVTVKTTNTISIATGLLVSSSVFLYGQTTISQGHVDIGIAYEDGAWNLHVHDESEPPPGGTEYAPGDVMLVVGSGAVQSAPGTPAYGFLGDAGAPVWILPQNEDPSLLFPGIATEEIEAGVFADDRIALTLAGYTGPGQFALYQVDGFGSPTLFMDTNDGLSAADTYDAIAGNHAHFNWAFTQPGTYTLSFEASANLLNGDLFTSSGLVDYTFSVVPEPSTWTLLGFGAAALGALARHARKRA
jgi:surface-anchored protein